MPLTAIPSGAKEWGDSPLRRRTAGEEGSEARSLPETEDFSDEPDDSSEKRLSPRRHRFVAVDGAEARGFGNFPPFVGEGHHLRRRPPKPTGPFLKVVPGVGILVDLGNFSSPTEIAGIGLEPLRH